MSLTPKQIERRKKYVGASDLNILMSGDSERILQLWRVKRGEIPSEDLSNVLPVQIGVATEAFNISWFEKQSGKSTSDHGREITSEEYPYMLATLDAMADE